MSPQICPFYCFFLKTNSWLCRSSIIFLFHLFWLLILLLYFYFYFLEFILLFLLLQTVFQSSYIILHIHHQWTRVPIFQYPHQYLLLFVLLILVILVGMKWYDTMALIYIFLMAIYVEIFSCTYWSFVYHLWRNSYSNSLTIF